MHFDYITENLELLTKDIKHLGESIGDVQGKLVDIMTPEMMALLFGQPQVYVLIGGEWVFVHENRD